MNAIATVKQGVGKVLNTAKEFVSPTPAYYPPGFSRAADLLLAAQDRTKLLEPVFAASHNVETVKMRVQLGELTSAAIAHAEHAYRVSRIPLLAHDEAVARLKNNPPADKVEEDRQLRREWQGLARSVEDLRRDAEQLNQNLRIESTTLEAVRKNAAGGSARRLGMGEKEFAAGIGKDLMSAERSVALIESDIAAAKVTLAAKQTELSKVDQKIAELKAACLV